jgi:hypothetical protein
MRLAPTFGTMTNTRADLRSAGSGRLLAKLSGWIRRIESLDPYGKQASTYLTARRKAVEGPPSPFWVLVEIAAVLGAAACLAALVTLSEPPQGPDVTAGGHGSAFAGHRILR